MEITTRISRGWGLVILALCAQSVGVAAAVWFAVRGVIADASNPLLEEYRSTVLAQGISVALVVLLGGVWVVVTLVGALRQRPWSRASTLTLQVLCVATATGVLQGILGSEGLGWALLAVGVLGLIGVYLSRPPKSEAEAAEGAR